MNIPPISLFHFTNMSYPTSPDENYGTIPINECLGVTMSLLLTNSDRLDENILSQIVEAARKEYGKLDHLKETEAQKSFETLLSGMILRKVIDAMTAGKIRTLYAAILKLVNTDIQNPKELYRIFEENLQKVEAGATQHIGFVKETHGETVERIEGEAIRSRLKKAIKLIKLHEALRIRDEIVIKLGGKFPKTKDVLCDLEMMTTLLETRTKGFNGFLMGKDQKAWAQQIAIVLKKITEDISEYETDGTKLDQGFMMQMIASIHESDRELSERLVDTTKPGALPREGLSKETVDLVHTYRALRVPLGNVKKMGTMPEV